jgi:hypothetical protein
MKIEENNQIPFLDMLVTRDKDQLRHTVYRKKKTILTDTSMRNLTITHNRKKPL